MSNRQRISPVAKYSIASIAAVSVGYLAYKAFTYVNGENEHEHKTGRSVNTSVDNLYFARSISKNFKKSIAIVVDKNLLLQGVPFPDILNNIEFSVLVLAPDVTFDDINKDSLNTIPKSQEYKVIHCQTNVGIGHVLKHIASDLVFIPNDLLYGNGSIIPDDVSRFVGALIPLDHNPTNTLMKYISE